jgi:hypothetical protein
MVSASAEDNPMNKSMNKGMNLTQLQSFPNDRVRALFGLEPAALGELLAAVLPPLLSRRHAQQAKKKNRKRAPGGGRTRKLLPYQEVLITLVYLRHNVSHAVCGQMFGVSADISENSFHEVVPLLRDLCPAHRWDAEKKWTKKEPSWHPDTLDQVLVDSFETPIARPSLPAVQKKFYSGKKKRHTIKSQILTDAQGEVLTIEPGHPGPLPDKTLYEQSAAAKQYPQAARRADLGYQGVPEMLVPHKKKRGKAGEKAKDLTPAQKEENQYAASQRVAVEHGVRRVKAWRILRDEYRLGIGLFPLIASATMGLVHLSRLVTGPVPGHLTG